LWWTISCLGSYFAGAAWCALPCAGAFVVCRARAGFDAFGACAFIAVGALPLDEWFPFGAAIAVPQSAPQTASANIIFCTVLFMVWFLSLLRASPFSRLHKVRNHRRKFLTKISASAETAQSAAPRDIGLSFAFTHHLALLGRAVLPARTLCKKMRWRTAQGERDQCLLDFRSTRRQRRLWRALDCPS